MQFFVYVIKNSVTNKIYIGQTNNVEERLKRHNGISKNKKTSFTSKNIKNGIWELIYKEEKITRSEVIIREKELKSYQGRQYIKSLFKAQR